MADALRTSCTAPVFKRPRLEYPSCEGNSLIPYDSVASEERFSIDFSLHEDPYEVTSTDHISLHPDGATSAQDLFPGTNGVHTTSSSEHIYADASSDQNSYHLEGASNLLESDACNESSSDPLPQDDLDDMEDQDYMSQASWIQRQKDSGLDPRMILGEFLPTGTLIPHNINDTLLWRYILNMMDEPRRSKLSHINTLDDTVNLLKTCKRIIVLTGAGVSVSCGIPDFRSRDGIYSRLSKDYPDLPDPQAMFDIGYFSKDPRPFFKFAKEIYPGLFHPSPSHRFIKLLEKQGKLLRNYTQNIDTLEHAAGIKNVITCHGSFATASCMACRHKVDASAIKEDIFNQTIPYCPVCPGEASERGVMKPDIVFFGEGLSDEFHECMSADKQVCDLLIVIGSSLKVRPVAMIPSSIPADVPQILINREPLKHLTFDVELLGDCDVIIGELCRRLQSDWAIDGDIPFTELKEINTTAPPETDADQPSSSDSIPSSTLTEINNNFEAERGVRLNGGQASLPQSDESNSCDYRGMSAIKLDDSEDGSNQEQVTSTTEVERQPKLDKVDNLPSYSKGNFPSKLLETSYLFYPPNRYMFQGAEVCKEYNPAEDDDCSSTASEFTSCSNSPLCPEEAEELAALDTPPESSPRSDDTTSDPILHTTSDGVGDEGQTTPDNPNT